MSRRQASSSPVAARSTSSAVFCPVIAGFSPVSGVAANHPPTQQSSENREEANSLRVPPSAVVCTSLGGDRTNVSTADVESQRRVESLAWTSTVSPASAHPLKRRPREMSTIVVGDQYDARPGRVSTHH